MRYPAQGPVTQGFSTTHLAIDIGGEAGKYFGTPILAPHDGTITAAGQMGTGTNDAGLAIDVTGSRFKSRLAHNNQILVSVGQVVKEGQQIGTQGYTGYTIPDNQPSSSHCHWVLWDNGVRVDGRNYIKDNGGGMTQDAIEKLVSKIYRVATDIDPTPEQAGYWVERIKNDNNTAYELPIALGADDYKGDPQFRYKGRHYSEDMTTAKEQAYKQGLADAGGSATVLKPGKYQVT